MAADGRWDELKVWQDQLDGGKPGVPAPGSATAAPATPAASTEPTYEDLTVVEGIGPKGQELLFQNGITTWADLSKADPNAISEILSANGMGAHDPTTWPRQAQMAAEGRWDELKVWQDELDGGKVVGDAAPAAVVKEELTKIEGIGPKVQEVLYSAGITSFAGLAEADPADITGVLQENGLGMHQPQTWPQQAALARDGKWDELQVLQDELDGGKPPE